MSLYMGETKISEVRIGGEGTTDHTKLTAESRAKPDQHPIGAITGLQGELDKKVNTPVTEGTAGQVLTNDGAGGTEWSNAGGSQTAVLYTPQELTVEQQMQATKNINAVSIDGEKQVRDINCDFLESNLIYHAPGETKVVGTGNYVYSIIKKVPAEISDYTMTCDNIVGAALPRSLIITLVDKDGNVVDNLVNIDNKNLVTLSVTKGEIDQGGTEVQFKLYPAQGTPLPTGEAVYTNVEIFKGIQITSEFKGAFKKAAQQITDEGIKALQTESRNVFAKESGWIPGGLYEGDYFIRSETGQNAVCLDYSEVDAEQKYTGQTETELAGMYVSEYDTDKKYIKSDSFYGAGAKKFTFETSASTKFIRVSTYSAAGPYTKAIPQKLQIEKGTSTTLHVDHLVWKPGLVDAVEVYKEAVKAGVAPGAEPVPAYYLDTGYLDDKINRINELYKGCAANGDCFLFITDEHWAWNAKRSPALINYIADRTNIPRLFNGGDMGNDDALRKDFYNRLKKSFNRKIYSAIGNHDYFYPSTENELYNRVDALNDNQIGKSDRHYYYVDNPQMKVRYVFLSAYKPGTSTDNIVNYGYEVEQLSWMTDVAFNVETGWKIIVITHMIKSTKETTPGGDEALAVIDGYAGNGEIVAIVQGHMHIDEVLHSPGGIPIITTTCDKNTPDEGNYPFTPEDRQEGTIKEQAFDVMIWDFTGRKATAVRIGAKADNLVDGVSTGLVEERVIPFKPLA